MKFRITKNGKAFTFENGGDALGYADVYGMDITKDEEEKLLGAMDDISFLGASILHWTHGDDEWSVEPVKEGH